MKYKKGNYNPKNDPPLAHECRVKDVRLFMIRNFYYAHFAPLSSLMPTYLSLIICFVISLLLSSYFPSFNIMAELQ